MLAWPNSRFRAIRVLDALGGATRMPAGGQLLKDFQCAPGLPIFSVVQRLSISLHLTKMVRLGAALTAERVLSTEADSSTQALICNAGEDTDLSEPIFTTTCRYIHMCSPATPTLV